MSIDITLNKKHHYILGYYYGDVDLNDIRKFNTIIFQTFHEITYDKLHVIADVSEVNTHHINATKAWEAIRKVAKHQKLGIVIVIGLKKPSIKFLIKLLAKLGGSDLRIVNTHDDAIVMLESLKVTI
ncbi:MAG: hypothetical protein Phog2KO_07790 [Phototrophicaceae bacterium]